MTIEQRHRYIDELKQVLSTLDLEEFKAFWKRWIGIKHKAELVWDLSYRITMYKVALACNFTPPESKNISREWLERNGYAFTETPLEESGKD